MKHLRAFEIDYLGATNTKGLRVRIKDLRFNKTKIIPFNYEYDNTKAIAKAYLDRIGIDVQFSAETKNGYLLLTGDFYSQLLDK